MHGEKNGEKKGFGLGRKLTKDDRVVVVVRTLFRPYDAINSGINDYGGGQDGRCGQSGHGCCF